MEIKYTTDGRKVRIVGKLNQSEVIVQEIFVDENGVEIPSGENFVVKSLHDKPVKSWKEKEIEKWDAYYDRLRIEHDTRIRDLKKQTENTKQKIRASYMMEKYFSVEKLKKLDLFIAGDITHYVQFNYGLRIVPFAKAHCQYDRDKLKLLSLFGESDGDLEWRLSHYSDGSGGSESVYPCTSYEEAIQKCQQIIDEYIQNNKKITSSLKKSATEYGLKIPKKYLQQEIEQSIESAKKDAEQKKEVFEKSIIKIEKLIEEKDNL